MVTFLFDVEEIPKSNSERMHENKAGERVSGH